ncbi:MAG: hypothetical protein IJ958_03200 [Agathobacter sp.]|nr:hypothetical protein [Agathobacter sp.]
MKKFLLSSFALIIILLFILIFFTLYDRSVRHTEVCNALTLSMKQSMMQLQLDEGKPTSEEDWTTAFVQSVATQIQSQSDLTIHIYESNVEKGLLSAEAILTFRNPIGTTSSVTTGKQTIILEEYYADY